MSVARPIADQMNHAERSNIASNVVIVNERSNMHSLAPKSMF